jgi:hypothetical protein
VPVTKTDAYSSSLGVGLLEHEDGDGGGREDDNLPRLERHRSDVKCREAGVHHGAVGAASNERYHRWAADGSGLDRRRKCAEVGVDRDDSLEVEPQRHTRQRAQVSEDHAQPKPRECIQRRDEPELVVSWQQGEHVEGVKGRKQQRRRRGKHEDEGDPGPEDAGRHNQQTSEGDEVDPKQRQQDGVEFVHDTLKRLVHLRREERRRWRPGNVDGW